VRTERWYWEAILWNSCEGVKRESGGEERDMSGIKEWIDTMFI
jgi:hypothetical protein